MAVAWSGPQSLNAVEGVYSLDGGLTWSTPDVVWSGSDVHLCEPGFVRSPRGAVTFYADEWDIILGKADDIRSFIQENQASLKKK